MNFPRLELTRNGIDAVLVAVYDGATITFTRCRLGSGSTSTPVADMTAMVNTVKTIGISSITVADSVATIAFSLAGTDVPTAFYMREIGIFAKVGDGDEFLYAYANAGDAAAYIKPYDQDSLVELIFTIHVAVGNAESVTAVISGAVGYTTEEAFNAHLHDYTNPHRVTKEQVGLGNVDNVPPSSLVIEFTKATTLAVPTTGSTLGTIIGLLAKAIESLAVHLRDRGNPHLVSYDQTGAAAANHTHAPTELSGTVPISKGGTGVTTTAALRDLINRLVSVTGDVFNLTIGNATKEISGGDVTFTLSEMGIDAETAFNNCKSSFVWGTDKIINRTTGALENAPANYDNIRYGRRNVLPGQEFRIIGWVPYNLAYFAIYDGNGNAISWYANVLTSYTTHTMYIQDQIVIPPGASYVYAIDFSQFTGHSLDEYSICVR